MTKVLVLITVLALTVFSTGAKTPEPPAKTAATAKNKAVEDTAGTPSFAVKSFYTAMAKADFSQAKKYLIAQELIDMIKGLEELIKEVPELKEDTKKEFAAQAKAKFISEKITGDKAEVVYSFLHEGKTKKETVKLKKVKNEWKIDE